MGVSGLSRSTTTCLTHAHCLGGEGHGAYRATVAVWVLKGTRGPTVLARKWPAGHRCLASVNGWLEMARVSIIPDRAKGLETMADQAPISVVAEAGRTRVRLVVNDASYTLDIEPRRTLLDALREDIHLTGAKPGCNMGNCGACTVLLDGEAVYSCLVLAVECEGRRVTTIEGLARDGVLDPVQRAFVEHDALQCGYCTPGQVLALKALLARNPHPSEEEIERGMSGNICRCGAYPKIRAAARALAAENA